MNYLIVIVLHTLS